MMFLGGCSSSAPPISLSVSPSSSVGVDQSLSVMITASVTNDRNSKGVQWALSGQGSLSSSTGPSVSYITPSTAITSAEHVTVTAISVADPTKNASVQITVNPYPWMPGQSLIDGTVGVPYSQPIELNGGTGPFQWSVYNGSSVTAWEVGGSVPSGLTLNPTTGTISGTPTTAGTWYFEATATDADNVFAWQPVSLQINPAASTAGSPVPFLNQPLMPTAVAPGGSGLTLQVSGAGFVSGATVNFNGAPLATTFVDGGHLSAVVPATDVARAETAPVTVVNPAPGGGASNTVYFQVGAPQATVSFAKAPNSPLQIPEPSGLAVADFNQDGRPDLAITAGVRVYTMLGNGDGTFTPATGSPQSIPSPPYDDFGSPYVGSIAVGDFTHSGHAGLAVALWQNQAAAILEGNGDGTFTTSSSLVNTQGYSTEALAAADFNADGNLDLAYVNSIAGASGVALGYGGGTFNAAGQFPYNGAGVAVGDFNGDGRLDVTLGAPVLLGNGDGTFTAANNPAGSASVGLWQMVAADFNGDGRLDLAGTNVTGTAVVVLLGNGDGTFQQPVTIQSSHNPAALVAGDFNNDGKLDLAVANSDETVTLLLGNGDGTFTEAAGSPFALLGAGPSAIAAADFNGDGKLDLAVANALDGTGTVSILLQQ
jgi:hypothetical protein